MGAPGWAASPLQYPLDLRELGAEGIGSDPASRRVLQLLHVDQRQPGLQLGSKPHEAGSFPSIVQGQRVLMASGEEQEAVIFQMLMGQSQ
jgi:hypothetical protein